jgi:hypothetical protein
MPRAELDEGEQDLPTNRKRTKMGNEMKSLLKMMNLEFQERNLSWIISSNVKEESVIEAEIFEEMRNVDQKRE